MGSMPVLTEMGRLDDRRRHFMCMVSRLSNLNLILVTFILARQSVLNYNSPDHEPTGPRILKSFAKSDFFVIGDAI
jgi:hypothetical protein